LPRALLFLHLFTLQVVSKRHCLSVLQAGTWVHKTDNSVLLSSLRSLSNSLCRHKRNVLLLRNVLWCSFPVASACNLLNQTCILTTNVKFPPCQHTNTSYSALGRWQTYWRYFQIVCATQLRQCLYFRLWPSFISIFWHLGFWNGLKIFGKFVDPTHSVYM